MFVPFCFVLGMVCLKTANSIVVIESELTDIVLFIYPLF